MYYVYIIECADGSLYTGYTNNLEHRFKEHQKGKASKYTNSHKPLQLIHTEQYSTRTLAMKREVEIKSWKREKKIDLIQS
jgi:putative endonuclease